MTLSFSEETQVGRNINRHYYTKEEVAKEVERPGLKKLLSLMRFRNSHPAFSGEFLVEDSSGSELIIRRRNGGHEAVLKADLKGKSFTVSYTENGSVKELSL